MCFSISWLIQIIVWLIVLSVVVWLIRTWVLPLFSPADPRIPATIDKILWAIVAIFIVYIIADLLLCLTGGGLGLPALRH